MVSSNLGLAPGTLLASGSSPRFTPGTRVTSVSLVCMPWHLLGSPSIQLGTLHALLQRDGIRCRSHSFHLEFQDFLASRSGGRAFTIDDYGAVSCRWENVGAGEWVFALPEMRADGHGGPARDERYLALLREEGLTEALIDELRALRELVPAFLERCADEVLASGASVVGCTSVYSQNWPSAALARAVKARDPGVKIVLGGSSCEGSMGPALLRAFPDIDVVVRGEAEGVLRPLMTCLLEGEPVPRLPGLCLREGGEIVEVPADRSSRPPLDELPVPLYDEYFERLSRSSLAHQILPQIPFESSRGCWWGMKSHCTFCGLNGLEMRFRSKSPGRVLDEISTLAARHGVLDFTAVDNIIDMEYFTTVLPELAGRGLDLGLFYETKANLTEAQVRAFRDAGVRTIQPGIESLSTSTLALMKKGVTAFQNIRLLRWCARHGIHVIWNLLYGFPGEDPGEYERMAELVPSLVHLPPPELSELAIYRFSPYHGAPGAHGLELGGPLPYYRLLYDLDEGSLRDLAQVFSYDHADGRDPRAYIGELRERVEQWKRDAGRNRGALTYRRGPGFLVLTDTRTTTEPARYTLGEAQAAAYLACDAGATAKSIAEEVRRRSAAELSAGELDELLRDLVAARLVYEEGGKYLALALPNAA